MHTQQILNLIFGMAIANIAIPNLSIMRSILALILVTFIISCKDDITENYYPDYTISAYINASRSSFIIDGVKNNNHALTFYFSAKSTGDNVGLKLSADTNSFGNEDTTWFSVTYKNKEELMFKDTGYAFANNVFTSITKVK